MGHYISLAADCIIQRDFMFKRFASEVDKAQIHLMLVFKHFIEINSSLSKINAVYHKLFLINLF
ncbi:hypothetical protein CO704_13235 [Cedecea neteri]|uniref:Uncharacterized protein n=1 Tax=Cedecea neteri TaxID=158822 RepID=A0A291DYV3_9ENTR|nr:hypothetical protein CO704_13235 [Cedecea neteri]